MWQCSRMLLVVLACASAEHLMGGHLDNSAGAKSRLERTDNSSAVERKRHVVDDLDPDLAAEESTVASSTDNDVPPRYHIPYPFAFNGGKPFSLEKDPITGKIDFEKAPPVKALDYRGDRGKDDGEEDHTERERINDDVGPNEINTYTAKLYDFLNLPINYSSEKYGNDKYPLISNSYANTKVQSGTNSYSTYNHRPYHLESDPYPVGDLYAPTSEAPVVTTWKPQVVTTTSVAFGPTVAKRKESATEEPSTTEPPRIATLVEARPNLTDNLVHSRVEANPQRDDYKDSYDIYESPIVEGEDESDYALLFHDPFERRVTSTDGSASIDDAAAATTSSSSEDTTTTTAAVTTVAPSSTQRTSHAGTPEQSVTEPNISHDDESTIESGQDGVGGAGGIIIESANNVVIPPDQDTVSFVLGNRQNVEGGYYTVGTAIGENPYGSLSDVKTWALRHETQHSAAVPVAEPDDRIAQKWWPGSSSLKSNNEIEPPRSQGFYDVANTVATKTRGEEKDDDASLPPTVTTASDNTKTDLPELAENLMPPAESSRPPSYYYHYQYDTKAQRLPAPPPPPRAKPGFSSGPPLDVGSRRRPYSPDAKLPNILPQFRPNAKASHGHRFGSDVIGTMPAGQSLSTRVRQPPSQQSNPSSRRPFHPPPPPSYLQRLNPPPPPIHAVRLAFAPTAKVDNVALPHETEPTIRKLRPPSSISRISTEENNPPPPPPPPSKTRNRGKSESADEREDESSERYPEEPPMTPPRPPLFPKRRTADPLHVTTLQMIQHHGELASNDENETSGGLARPVEPVLAHQAERRKSDNKRDSLEIAEQPVYVVYPVNVRPNDSEETGDDDDDDGRDDDGSVVVGTRGPHRPLPPDTLLQDEREHVQQHTVYNGRPVALDFPYPLEHPDPASMFPVADAKETPLLVPSEQRQQTVVTSEKNDQDTINVIPYLQDFLPFQKKNDATISVTLHRTAPISAPSSTSPATLTSTPIAYVYTPTHAYPTRRLDNNDDDDDDDDDATATVLLPSQQPSSSSSSAPAPQNFMAPFVASINAAETSNKNGWSVVVVEPPLEADKRLDSDNDDATKRLDADAQTEKNDFDVDNFKPQLFGGFKPIYEFPAEDLGRREGTNTETNASRRSKESTVPDER